jgi:hypothetical protein
MFVNVVNKHVLFYLIVFGLLEQWEGETNGCDRWPSKSIPLKLMREIVKRKDGEMQGEIGKDTRIN